MVIVSIQVSSAAETPGLEVVLNNHADPLFYGFYGLYGVTIPEIKCHKVSKVA